MSRRSGWFHVEATEQKRYVAGIGWTGYSGWVAAGTVVPVRTVPECNFTVRAPVAPIFADPSKNRRPLALISMGTRFASTGDTAEGGKLLEVRLARGGAAWIERAQVERRGLREEEESLRQGLVAAATKFVGSPYLWGGRSMYMPEASLGSRSSLLSPPVVTGVDCSGLVSLVFRAYGIDLPRNAHDQWLWADPVEPRQCLRGDLFFLTGQGDPQTVVHVMLSAGGEEIIEAPDTGGAVRSVTFQERFGLTRQALSQAGWETDGRKLYCGTVIPRVRG